MPSNVYGFLWRTSTSFVTSLVTSQNLLKKLIDREHIRVFIKVQNDLTKQSCICIHNFKFSVAFSFRVSVYSKFKTETIAIKIVCKT